MKFSFLYSFLFLFGLAVQAQNVFDNSTSFSSDMKVGASSKEVLVTIKTVGGHTYMDFKRKGEFFQINLSALNKTGLFKSYEELKTLNSGEVTPLGNCDLNTAIGFSSKGSYKASPDCAILFSVLNTNGVYSLVITFPETHDTQSQNAVFNERTITISDVNVQLFEKSLLEEATYVAIHVHK